MPKSNGGPKTTPKMAAARRKGTGSGVAPGPTEAFQGPAPSHEEIAQRAYALFLARGGLHGDDWGDWFRAEADLRGADARKPEISRE
jgi:hypothetical protein